MLGWDSSFNWLPNSLYAVGSNKRYFLCKQPVRRVSGCFHLPRLLWGGVWHMGAMVPETRKGLAEPLMPAPQVNPRELGSVNVLVAAFEFVPRICGLQTGPFIP